MGVDPGPELKEDPGHGAVTCAGGLHQRRVTILIVILEHGVRVNKVLVAEESMFLQNENTHIKNYATDLSTSS